MQEFLKITSLILLVLPGPGIAADALPLAVQSALNHRQIPHDTLSIYIEDLDSGDVVLRWQAAAPRNPGSTIKLLTTLVALDVLGPTYTWQTDIYALGSISD